MFDDLKFGDTNEMVKIIQEKLKQLNLYNSLITGSFGDATKMGVEAFQSLAYLPITGVVDLETWNKLIEYTSPAISPISIFPVLRRGSTGEEVKDLKTKLKALLYYTGDITSNFDLETENAVKRFQLNNKLTADGIVGNNTWNILNSLYGNLNDCVLNNESNDNNNYITYKVEKGDTLYGIAKKYDTTVNEIKSLNNLTSDILSIGQILKIPKKSNDDYINYIVVRGDTLYGIAKKYGTTVQELKNINNLTNDTLMIGQVLKVPQNTETNYIDYIVMKGDTLYGIARKYNTTVATIKSINNLTSNILSIGQVLKIPV